MGAILASTTIGRVQTTLLDNALTAGGVGVTWNTAAQPGELLDYYNASVRTIGMYVPSSITKTEPALLVAGARQVAAGTFVGVRSNSAGRAVTPIDMDDLDHMLPDWRNAAPAPAEHYTSDKRDASTFWVYPPSPEAQSVELSQIVVPDPVALTDPNPLDDQLEPAIYWLILAYAYGKNTNRGDLAKSNAYLQRAGQALGLNDANEMRLQPMAVMKEQADG